MKLKEISLKGNNYKQVQRRTAKKMYLEGKEIFLAPCNFNLYSIWFDFCCIKKLESDLDFETFESKTNSFDNYNCNGELGRYAHFYVKLN